MTSYIYAGMHLGLFLLVCTIANDNRSAWPFIFYFPALGAWIWIWQNRNKKIRKQREEFGEKLIASTGSNSGGVHYYTHPTGNPGSGSYTGIALNLATKTVALKESTGLNTQYSFGRIRSWESDGAQGVFCVTTDEPYEAVRLWRIEMPSKEDRNRWTEIFRQALTEGDLKVKG